MSAYKIQFWLKVLVSSPSLPVRDISGPSSIVRALIKVVMYNNSLLS
jgi:hypothetical protein